VLRFCWARPNSIPSLPQILIFEMRAQLCLSLSKLHQSFVAVNLSFWKGSFSRGALLNVYFLFIFFINHWKPITTSSASIKGDNTNSPNPTATLSNHPSFSHLTFIFFFFKFNISCFGFVFACTICGGVCFFFACPHKAINQ